MTVEERRTEWMRVVVSNKDYQAALDKVQKNGSDFTLYSCTDEIIAKVVAADDKQMSELIELINEANSQEKHISTLKIHKNKVDGLKMFFNAFDDDQTKERLFVLMGETGVGKSYVIEERYPNIIQYACNKSLDTYSLCYYLTDNGNGLSPQPTPFLNAIVNGGKVFMDEMNELPHETLMFIQGITDEKSSVVIGDQTVKISPKFKLLAALNPPSETDERTPLGDALLSRAVGYVMELTDEMICKRVGKTKKWLSAVRKLYTYVANSGLIDVRELSFRDYQRFAKYDFETQFKFKVCMGDVSNIRAYNTISTTGEYASLVNEVYNSAS